VSRGGWFETRPPCLASKPSFASHPNQGFLGPGRTLDSRELRPARPGHADIGLGRRTYPSQGAFHRLDPDLAAGADPSRARFYTCTDRPSTLVACREPRQPRQRSGGRFKLPRSPRPAFRRAARPRRRCFSPMSATDPRNEHPSEDSIPGRAAFALRTCDPEDSIRRNAGGASLDGEPPASANIAHRRTRAIGAEAAIGDVDETPLGPGGRCDRKALRRVSPWPRRCRPQTGLAT
jgi:hypothetical protein